MNSAIEVETKFSWLQFLFFFFKTLIVIDGQDTGKQPWGKVTFPVAPGPHQVRVSVRYLAMTNAMANEIAVDVAPGQVVHVRYRAPWLAFLKGKIEVVGASAAPGTPQ